MDIQCIINSEMQTKLQKWGNSTGVRIPKIFLKELGIKEGQEIDIKILEGTITLSKSIPSLEELVEKITPQNRHGEIDTGPIMGNEQW